MSQEDSASTPQLLVLGGGYAGVMAANRLCSYLPKANVTLIDDTGTFAHRIRLHEFGAARPLEAPKLERYLNDRVQVRIARVHVIHPDEGFVELESKEGTNPRVAYDGLVYALGSGYGGVAFPGLFEHAHALGHWAGAKAIRSALLGGAQEVVVIGGGLTALEGATEIASAFPDAKVTLVSQGAVDRGLSHRGGVYLRGRLDSLGIEVLEGSRALGATEGGVELEGGRRLSSDCTVWAGGGLPSPIAKASGLPIDDTGRVLVDGDLSVVGHGAIVAVGDCASARGRGGAPLAMTCNAAMPMGAHGAKTLAARFLGTPTEPFDFAWLLRCISLGPGRGLVQMLDPDGGVKDSIVSGRAGAVVKSIILGMVTFFLSLEARTGWPLYQWAHLPDTPYLGEPAKGRGHG